VTNVVILLTILISSHLTHTSHSNKILGTVLEKSVFKYWQYEIYVSSIEKAFA